jgi:lysophospholipase
MELSSDESKILLLSTGGTICMIPSSTGGYSPEPYFLTEFLRAQDRFHDPLQDSLFSHSGSSDTFREWSSNSGRNTPTKATPPISQPTLTIKSTRPIGVTSLAAKERAGSASSKPTTCTRIAENIFEAQVPSLVTPRSSSGQGGKRIRYAILEAGHLHFKFIFNLSASLDGSGIRY